VDQVILAFECTPADVALCVPESILELFQLPVLFGPVNRTVVYIFLAAFVVIGVLYFAFRQPRLVPTKFGVAVESLVRFVRDDIAVGVIGPGGEKYAPYLLSLFLFILVGNFFGLTPLINFPIGSRMAIPLFLSLLTYVIFVGAGIKKQGLGYIGHMLWPSNVPVFVRWLVGPIEIISTLIVRPFSLAVRLFANLVAGHTMLALLLGTAIVFWVNIGTIGFIKGGLVGTAWFALGMAIFLLEMLVLFLQAYIFTLLSAVYIESSLHPAH
jgi:F-type H+-transporting ATPase subunit a